MTKIIKKINIAHNPTTQIDHCKHPVGTLSDIFLHVFYRGPPRPLLPRIENTTANQTKTPVFV